MQRAASRLLSSRSTLVGEQISAEFISHRWTYLLSTPCSSRLIPPPPSHSRALHSTVPRLQQQQTTSLTAATDTAAAASVQHVSSSTSAASTASSSSVSASLAPPTDGGPMSVTAVTTPLSRSAAASSRSSSASPSPLRLLRVPHLELGDARLSKWLVPADTAFPSGCVLCELDTDMAVIEYKADRPGWLALHIVQEGDEVHVDQPIAVACDSEEQAERVRQEWGEKVERKERERELRAERPAHSLSEDVAAMKE